ncbi:MAG: penicillin-binding protein [Actinobacteria bacterium]|nr:penicillin-binding protein [Actinomycetota bacterium]
MRARAWLFLLFVVLVGAVAGGAFAFAVQRTEIPQASDVATAQATVVYWDDGTTELGRFGEVNRTDVALGQLPTHLPAAVLTAEDRDFFAHTGFSPTAIARAIVNNLRGGPTQGGSTITQQYAKNAFLTQDQTVARKARELLLAVKLETLASKDIILERYLNTIYFGRGTYGVQAAAREYFNKDAADLDVSEAAFLAAVIRSPGNYDPDFNFEQAESRWNFVLDGMVAEQVLPAAEREGLRFPKVRAIGLRQEFAGTRGYLLETVRQQLYDLGFSESDLDLRGLRVTSTFNRENQRALVKAVNDQGPKGDTTGVRVGAVSVRPGTGEIVALFGGEDYLTNQLNNATQATAMAGSTFKPFALVAALENDISLQSKWDGRSPRRFFDYRVRNYGNFSYKKIPLLQATVKSVNTVYVALGLEVGPSAVKDVAVRAGLPADTPGLLDNATIVLGSASPTALGMANAYATFAAAGVKSETSAIKEVRGANGGLLYQFEPRKDRVFQTDVMADLNFALVQSVSSGTGAAASVPGHQVAGKTGTTDDDMSAWFVGYTPELATAVFLSRQNAEGSPISLKGVGGLGSVTGGTFPARIWGAYMKEVLADRPPVAFAPPANVGDTTDTDLPLPDDVVEVTEEGLFPETTPDNAEITDPLAPPSNVIPPVEPVVPLPVTP